MEGTRLTRANLLARLTICVVARRFQVTHQN
jgi:hypothetical protein